MDIKRVKAIAENPKRTQEELEQMRANALRVGGDDVVIVVERILRERFPKSWPALPPKVTQLPSIPETPSSQRWRFGFWTKYKR